MALAPFWQFISGSIRRSDDRTSKRSRRLNNRATFIHRRCEGIYALMSILLLCNVLLWCCLCFVFATFVEIVVRRDFQSQLYPRDSKYLLRLWNIRVPCFRAGVDNMAVGGIGAGVTSLVTSSHFRRARAVYRKSVREFVWNRIVYSSRTLELRTFFRERWIQLNFHGKKSRQDDHRH